jgi:hypothetical protein
MIKNDQKLVQTRSDTIRHDQTRLDTLIKLGSISADRRQLITHDYPRSDILSDMFRHVQTCSDMFRHVQTCSDMFRHVQTCFWIKKNTLEFFKIRFGFSKYILDFKKQGSLEKMGQSCTGRLDLSALTVTIFSNIVQMQSCGLEFRHIILCYT